MRILVTAGNTKVYLDKVRCLTNIFTGRTGTAIASYAADQGHSVTLLTSHPELTVDRPAKPGWDVLPYSTFEDLEHLMAEQILGGGFDVVIHCAAVSDYLFGGIYGLVNGVRFDPREGMFHAEQGAEVQLIDRAAGKVKSNEPELWVRLTRAPKLVDKIRSEWGFRGILVKFKLEVGVSEEQLVEIAERSRVQSGANLMVANTLEGAGEWAMLGPVDGKYISVTRRNLPSVLFQRVEQTIFMI